MSQTKRTASLLAGAAQVDITPPAGTHVSGSVGAFRPAQSIVDRLYAKAVVLEQGDHRLALVGLDVTIITEEWTAAIREGAQRLGLAPEAVMVHATQTHTAPGVGYFMLDPDFPPLPEELEWLKGGQRVYSQFVAQAAVQALEEALASRQPVQIAAGSAVRDGLAFNRRAVMRDGTVSMPFPYSGLQHPLGLTDVRYPEGPSDPEVGVVCLRNEQLEMVAMLLHFTCHPVNVFPLPVISADWPGAWARAMQENHGPACVALVLNGACGNLNPWPLFQPDFVRDHQRMGRALAEATENIIRRLTFAEARGLDYRLTRLPLPLREVPPERLESARQRLEAHPQPEWSASDPANVAWEWFMAASVWSLELMRRRQLELPYEIQAFRVGDTALIGLPGEPFVEGQLALKIASPAYPTYVAHCTSEYVGYIPTREAYPRGGHEVNPSYWSKLAPGALERIVEKAAEMARELFPA